MAISNLFNVEWYLNNNPDVRAAVEAGLVDAETHFMLHGRFEGRSPSPSFDPAYYLARNPDVRAAVEAGLVTAYDHFLLHGASEARPFVAFFDVHYYLDSNPDVRSAVGDDLEMALTHFLTHGQSETRAISPFFDLRAYLEANPDVAAAVENGAANALDHLLNHGFAEGRPLGNGVSLEQFANDPTFKGAADALAALARVAEVAPFIPSFEPPAGWTPPADLPIPTDFVPRDGEKLKVPPTVKVPDGVKLPDAFEPSVPEEPVKPEEPGTNPGGGGVPTFRLTTAVAAYEAGELPSKYTLLDPSQYFENVSSSQAIVIKTATNSSSYSYFTASETTETEPGTLSLVANHDLLLESTADVTTAHFTLNNSNVSLPNDKATNVLVHAEGAVDPIDKDLTITVNGTNQLDLGNGPNEEDSIGYTLGSVTVEGEGDLELGTLYFGDPGTKFSSAELEGNVHLDAFVYTGSGSSEVGRHEWSIEFGDGDDTLQLHNSSGTGTYPWAGKASINGGEGNNTLKLNAHTYDNWHSAETSKLGAGTVTGFQTLEITETSDDATYISTLLGNQFDNLVLAGNENKNITIEGFQAVDTTAVSGIEMEIVASTEGTGVVAGTGNDTITVVSGMNTATTIDGGEGYDELYIAEGAIIPYTGSADRMLPNIENIEYIRNEATRSLLDFTHISDVKEIETVFGNNEGVGTTFQYYRNSSVDTTYSIDGSNWNEATLSVWLDDAEIGDTANLKLKDISGYQVVYFGPNDSTWNTEANVSVELNNNSGSLNLNNSFNKIDITGTGDLTYITFANQFNEFDASGLDGDITIQRGGDPSQIALTADATITTGTGNDSLNFGTSTGDLTIDAGDGNDTIVSGTGQNNLTGGAGADTFKLAIKGTSADSLDVIQDFNTGDAQDTLQFGNAKMSAANLHIIAEEAANYEALLAAANTEFASNNTTSFVAGTIDANTYVFYGAANGDVAEAAVQIIGTPELILA